MEKKMKNPENDIPQNWAKRYYTIFAGQSLSIFGSGLVQFALVWYLTQQTGSATVLALATLAGLLPETLLSPIAGTLVDRWNRKMIMIVADAAIAAATVVLAVLFAAGLIQVWHIYVILVIRSIGGMFHYSAMYTSTSLLVPSDQLQRVSGINQTLRASISIVAPPTGALLLSILPMQGVLAIDVTTALIGMTPLFFYAIPQPVREMDENGQHKTSVMQDMKEGFVYLITWRGILAICVMALMANFLLTPTGSLMPLLVTKHFGLGALQFGMMDSIFAFGMVLGGVALGVWGGFSKKIVTAMTGLVGLGMGILIVGLAPANMFWLAVAGMTLSGLMNPITNGPLNAIIQSTVKPEMQGRVMGVLVSLSTLMTPIGLAIAGPVSDAIGIRTWYWVAGLACLLMGIGSFFVPVIMNVESESQIEKENAVTAAVLQPATD
jgi:DHA3 family macrolide efflux protein-like MFS transporter